MNSLARTPYLSERYATKKNLIPLPTIDAAIKLQRFTEKSPAESVNTLYGNGETDAKSIVITTCSLNTFPKFATSASTPYKATRGAPTYA